MQRYDERLWVPWWVWVVTVFLVATVGLAFSKTGSVLATVAATALAGSGAAFGLLRYGGAPVTVTDTVFQAGRARLPLRHVGAVQVLDPGQARRLRGPEADARAYLLLRGYVATAVRVDVDDPADPTPYWYVSTRRPEAVAAALATARGDRPAR